MEEMLKEMMGESFKEGMTKDDIQSFFKKQVLSSGEYARKEATDAKEQDLKRQLQEVQTQLKNKMTDDEKKAAKEQDVQKEIENLKNQLAERDKLISKKTAISSLADAKIKAGIKDDDKEYEDFISGISFQDNDKTDKISKYISKIITSAYEAGKSDAIKNKLGKMGGFKEGSDATKGNSDDDKGAFGKELAQKTKVEIKGEKNFFERK